MLMMVVPGIPAKGRGFLDRIGAAGARPEWFCLEVTESAILYTHPALTSNIQTLASAGVNWAIDDFGTGYSSLERLIELPFGCLKIDRSFVASMDEDPRMQRLVVGVASLALDLGLHVVAEGVERISQQSELMSAGCPAGQGHLYSAAVSRDEIEYPLDSLDRWATQ